MDLASTETKVFLKEMVDSNNIIIEKTSPAGGRTNYSLNECVQASLDVDDETTIRFRLNTSDKSSGGSFFKVRTVFIYLWVNFFD